MTWGFNSLQENFSTPFSIEYPIPFRPRPVFFTQIAQWLKRFPEKKKIVGSNLTLGNPLLGTLRV